MKKIIAASVLITVIGLSLFIPHNAGAADHNIGLYGFYAWWKPTFRDYYNNYESDEDIFIMGPVYSVKFLERWTFSALLLIDINNITDASYTIDGTSAYAPGTPYEVDIKTTVSRTDLDLSLSYQFKSNISGFIGCKVIDYTLGVEDIDPEVTVNAPYSTSSNVATWPSLTWLGIGPAAGVIYTQPLNDFLYLNVGTSLLYSAFFVESREVIVDGSGVITSSVDEGGNYKYNAYGNNTTLNLACYISPLSASIIIGGRFQVLKYFSVDDAPAMKNDYFYGITVAAVYHI